MEAGLRTTGEEDVESAALLACVRSGLLVRAGDAAAGIAEARQATALLDGADAPVTHAEALLALAEACEADGDNAAAAAARERAASECRAKGIWSRWSGRPGPARGASDRWSTRGRRSRRRPS